MGLKGLAVWDGTGIFCAQDEGPEAGGEPAPPPPEPTEAPPSTESGEQVKEGVWEENYDEVIEVNDDEEAAKKEPMPAKKNRHIVGIITLIVIVVILVLWTVLSPKVMPSVGRTYLDENTTYANLGNFTGVRSIWAGTTTWGVSIAGPNTSHAGDDAEFHVLITKVSESTGNFFFRGTAIVITNVSLYEDDGTFIASLSQKISHPYGKEAVIKTSFSAIGNYSLYITAKFTVYESMRIGYFPLESVNVQRVDLQELIVITEPGTIIPT